MFRDKGGFTLIEMLVVIAMIGILSAVVLTALGPSRNKAKDTRIISDVNQARAIGETLYNGNTGTYSFCSANTTAFNSLVTDVLQQGPGGLVTSCNTNDTQAAYSAQLNGGGYYCVDTTGKTSSNAASGGACP